MVTILDLFEGLIFQEHVSSKLLLACIGFVEIVSLENRVIRKQSKELVPSEVAADLSEIRSSVLGDGLSDVN